MIIQHLGHILLRYVHITVKELYYGDEYNVIGEVFKNMILSYDCSMNEQTRLAYVVQLLQILH